MLHETLYQRGECLEKLHHFRLLSDYSDQLFHSGDNIVIDRNGFNFTGSAVGALTVDESFESGVDAPPTGWAATNSGTGATTWNSTGQAHSGTYSAKCAITATGNARLQRNLSSVDDGEIITYEAWFYVDMASFASGRIVLLKTHGGVQVKLNGAVAPYLSISNGAGTISLTQAPYVLPFPLQTWVKVTLRLRKFYGGGAYPYSGGVELWQSDKKIISAVGGVLSSDRVSETLVYFGAMDLSTITATTVYVDDVKIVSDSLPAQSAGLVLAGTAQVLL
jgi:hypothetical protein